MAERPHDACTILRGWVTIRLNVMLKSYVCSQYLWTVPLHGTMVILYILPLEIFTQRHYVADFIRLKLKLNFYSKKQKIAFESLFGYSSLESPWSTSYSMIAFSYGIKQNIRIALLSFVTKHACDDRRKDKITTINTTKALLRRAVKTYIWRASDAQWQFVKYLKLCESK